MKNEGKTRFVNRNVLLLLSGQGTSEVGNQLFPIAFTWLVITLTNSPVALSIFTAALALPGVAFRLVGGIIIDRINKKFLLIFTDLSRGVLVLLLAVLILSEHVTWWNLLYITVGLGVGEALFTPTYSAVIPLITRSDQLLSLNSLLQMVNQGIGILVPPLAGVFIAFLGIPAAMLVNSISFFISALTLLFLVLPTKAKQASQGLQIGMELREGFQAVFSNRLISTLFIAAGIINFADALMVIYPLHIKEALGAGVTWYGFLSAAVMVGLFSTNLLYTLVGKRIQLRRKFFVLAALIEGLGVLIFGLSRNLYLDVFAFYLFGAGMAGFFTGLTTLIQQEVGEGVRGRVFSLYGIFSRSLMPVGFLAAGSLAKITSTAFVLSLAGIIMIVTAFWLFFQQARQRWQPSW
jgi:DHA3 family macrolide efflux protein-like MFS transporter